MLSLRRLSKVSSSVLAFCVIGVSLLGDGFNRSCEATQLPNGLFTYLKSLNPKVTVRFDGLITFANGQKYLPVFPQDPTLNPDPSTVVFRLPDKVIYPDLIQFDNNLFLLRLIPTQSGKLTFIPLKEYPLALKEGLLPQDLVLPENLYLPAELKIILGALPYHPQVSVPQSTNPAKTPSKTENPNPLRVKPKSITATKSIKTSGSANPGVSSLPTGPVQPASVLPKEPGLRPVIIEKRQYTWAVLSDILNAQLFLLHPARSDQPATVKLSCLPTELTADHPSQQVFVSCLNTAELAVVDPVQGVVSAKIPMSGKPYKLILNQSHQAFVSLKDQPWVNVINTQQLQEKTQIAVPGSAGVLQLSPDEKTLFVAHATEGKVFVMDSLSQKITQTLETAKNIAGLWQVTDSTSGLPVLWVLSKVSEVLQAIDLKTRKPLFSVKTGAKPSAGLLISEQNRLWIASVGDHRLEGIDLQHPQAETLKIALPEGAFPSDISWDPVSKRIWVVSTGLNQLMIVDPETLALEKTVTLNGRIVRGVSLKPSLDLDKPKNATSSAPPPAILDKFIP